MSQYVEDPGSVTGIQAGIDEQTGFADELMYKTMAAGHARPPYVTTIYRKKL